MTAMRRRGWWLAVLLMGAWTLRGWAAEPPASTEATQYDVARLEALLDEVDRLDREIEGLKKQRLSADQQTSRRAELAAEIETLLPAFPKLRQEWRRRQTVQRSQAMEERLDRHRKRHDAVLERDAINTRLKR